MQLEKKFLRRLQKLPGEMYNTQKGQKKSGAGRMLIKLKQQDNKRTSTILSCF